MPSRNCIHLAAGCATYYAFLPLVWTHAIVTSAWTTTRVVYHMSKEKKTERRAADDRSRLEAREAYCALILREHLAELEAAKSRTWEELRPPAYSEPEHRAPPPEKEREVRSTTTTMPRPQQKQLREKQYCAKIDVQPVLAVSFNIDIRQVA